MTRKTHEQYSISFALLTSILFYKLGVTQINYYFATIIMVMASKAGALFPDLDHSWQNVHDKTVINKIVNTLIHITGGKHRSWQTHSIDICIYFTVASYIVPQEMYNYGKLDLVNKEVITIILLGFASGWVSHLISDMLTSAGVRLICFVNFKVKFVPKQLFGFKFNTGHEWEEFNYKAVKMINIALWIMCLAYPLVINSSILK